MKKEEIIKETYKNALYLVQKKHSAQAKRILEALIETGYTDEQICEGHGPGCIPRKGNCNCRMLPTKINSNN